jgi:2-keto-4-pentenoate hydratase/2-oxohepta-3-ene-1,7-dioic acid hydratase in catechol pathway
VDVSSTDSLCCSQLEIAPYPVVFIKPSDALAGPYDDVEIFKEAQSQLDYEGELAVVIGKDGKNISEEDALDHVLGYTASNDVSARFFQLPPNSGGQFCYAKSFDKFAPIGPCIVSPSVIKDPQNINFSTKVNGKIRQESNTSDMIWSVRQIIHHLSRGTTLRKGTVIMTGTPSGIGLFTKDGLLKDGDQVQISFEGIGAINNKMVFE